MAAPHVPNGRNATTAWSFATPDDLGFLPSPVLDALNVEVDALRPWQNLVAVERMLATFISDRWSDVPEPAIVALDVAEWLRHVGQSADIPDRDQMTKWTWHKLAQTAFPRRDDFDNVIGIPSRTIRSYRAQHGGDAFRYWATTSLQQDLDIAALVNGGRTPAAARQWLRSNPGKHAHEAPPPRSRSQGS